MASDAPLPSEMHKVTIVLDGAKFKPQGASRRPKYLAYMKKLRALAKQHGARVLKPELQVKQSTITRSKKNRNLHVEGASGRTARTRR